MRSTLSLSLVALVAMLAISPWTGEAQVRAMDLDDLTNEATYIVRANVTAKNVYWTENALGNMIVSDYELRVTDTVKGAIDGTVVLQCYGGQIGDLRLHASEEAAVAVGEDVVLFLADHPLSEGRYQVHGAFQGKYEVIGDSVRELQDVTYDRFRADIVRRLK